MPDELELDEERLARDAAVACTFDELVTRHGFETYQALEEILRKPHIKRLIKANQDAAEATEKRIKQRLKMRGDEIAETLLEKATNPKDPNHASIATWAIDRIAPTTQKHEHTYSPEADSELIGQFVDAVGELQKLRDGFRSERTVEGIQHLRSGKDMIAARDMEILPEGTSR